MIVYPVIELQGGQCVSLNRGVLGDATVWQVDPVETAHGFGRAGAEWMHLTDLDAIQGNHENEDMLAEIIRAAHIPVQLAGGFRSRERVERWIDRGAGRIVIATLAVQDPNLVKSIAEHHPDQIVLAVDVRQGKLMCDGWRQAASISPADFVAGFEGVPLAGILVTDVERDTDACDAQLGVISGIARRTRHPVIASGIVRGVDDIARLRYAADVSGVLVGRALVQGRITLAQALTEARAPREMTAEFL